MNDNVSNDSTKLAGRTYDTSDYQKKDHLSSGLATTHEQVSDTYMEGEIDADNDIVKGKNILLNNKITSKE